MDKKMKTKIIICCFVILLTYIGSGIEPDLRPALGAGKAIIDDFYYSCFPDVPVPDDGNDDPFIDPNNPKIRYIGRPRTCLNFPNGPVNANTFHGIHRTHVMKQKDIGTIEMPKWENVGFVTDDENINLYKTVGIGEEVYWNLDYVGGYGIFINFKSGTMEGTVLGSGLSRVISGLIGVISYM